MPQIHSIFIFIIISFIVIHDCHSANRKIQRNRRRNHHTKRPIHVDSIALTHTHQHEDYKYEQKQQESIGDDNQWKPILDIASRTNRRPIETPQKVIILNTEKYSKPYNSLTESSVVIDDFGAPIKSKIKRKLVHPRKNPAQQYEVHEYINEDERIENKYRYRKPTGRDTQREKHIHHIHYHDSNEPHVRFSQPRTRRLQ